MMRIVIVTPYYLPYRSGITVYVDRLARCLRKRGHRVVIITNKYGEGYKGEDVIEAKPLIKYQRGCLSPSFLPSFLSEAERSDVIIENLPLPECLPISIASKVMRKKLILVYHSDLKTSDSFFFKGVEYIYYKSVRVSCKLSDKIVVNSMEYVRSSKIRDFEKKCVSVFPPIDTEIFKNVGNVLKKKLGIENSFVIGFLGRFGEEKGLRYLVKAMKYVKGFFDVKLIMAGTGERLVGGKRESVRKELDHLVEKLGLKDDVIVLGSLSERKLVEFYSSCDVFVFPSIAVDSFGMAQAEAMLCGSPVVCSDLPGASELVKRTGFGMVCRRGDEKSLSRAIIEVLRNRKKFEPRRDLLLRLLGTEKTCDFYENLIEDLVDSYQTVNRT